MQGVSLKKHFSLVSSSQVSTICDQLLPDIGITYFNYIKIYHDDCSRELLTNNAAWIEHFYNHGLYQTTGAINIEHLLPKGYFLWSELDGNDPAYVQGRESFNIDNGVSFVIKEANVTHLYIFAAKRDNYHINNYYIRNIDLFKHFILYFKDKAAPLIQEASKHRIYLPEQQVVDHQRLKRIEIDPAVREKFYAKANVDKFYFLNEYHDFYVTKKQAECAAYLVAGATAKQIAKVLDVSYRTVEDHIDCLKTKIASLTGERPTKDELIKFLKKTGIYDAVFPQKLN